MAGAELCRRGRGCSVIAFRARRASVAGRGRWRRHVPGGVRGEVSRAWGQFEVTMAFTLYSLMQAALLCVNAIAVLHEERFLKNSECPGGGEGGRRWEPGRPGEGRPCVAIWGLGPVEEGPGLYCARLQFA